MCYKIEEEKKMLSKKRFERSFCLNWEWKYNLIFDIQYLTFIFEFVIYSKVHTDLHNVIFFTQSKFKAQQFYPQKTKFLARPNSRLSSVSNKKQWNRLKFCKIHLRTIIIDQKIP